MRQKKITYRYLNTLTYLVVAAAAVLLFRACGRDVQDTPEHYYLTLNHRLLECSYLSTRIYHQKGETGKIDPGFFYPGALVEKDHYLYAAAFSRSGKRSRIIRINPDDNTFDTLYRPRGKNRLDRNVYIYNDTIACIEKDLKSGERFLVLLRPGTKTFKKIRVSEKLERKHYYSVVFGADEVKGKSFRLIYMGFYPRWSILKVWEDGKVEKLGMCDIVPVYNNGILITGDSRKIVFSKVAAEGLEEIETLPGEKGLVLHLHQGGGRNLDQNPSEELYGVIYEKIGDAKWKKALRLDLKTLEFTEVRPLENSSGSFYYCHPDTWYYVHIEYDVVVNKSILKGMYRLKRGTLELVKEFEAVDLSREDSFFEVYDAGFVLKKDGRVNVYSLPGLEKIEFKSLR